MIQLLHSHAKTLASVAALSTLTLARGPALAQGTSAGQTESPKPPTLPAARATQAPVLDGVLDEPVWRTTQASDAFTQKFPAPGQPGSEPTTVRILYDDEAIYVGIVCTQARSIITRRLTRRDRPIETDSVTVAFDSRRDGTTAFQFTVTAAGVLLDGIRYNDTEYDATWDENWDAHTRISEQGWSAEFKIPLRVLRFDHLPMQDWGMQVRRYVSQRQETDEWVYIPRTEAGEVSRYGKLTGLTGLKPGGLFEIRPFVVGRVGFYDLNDDPRKHALDLSGRMGIDFKLHLTQNLTLDATVNPDFGQVEADQVVLNLTSYEVFYPEKRPFFLEGIDTFATPLQLLYTRRIGRPPEAPALRTDAPYRESAIADPLPSTLYGAAKLMGSIGRRLTIGTLSALAAPNEVTIEIGERDRISRVAESYKLFNVARLKLRVGDNAHVGLAATAMNHIEDATQYPLVAGTAGNDSAQLCPSGDVLSVGSRCTHDAYVVGVDGRWRSKSGTYVASGQVILSAIVGGPPRMLPDGTVISSGDVAPGGFLYVAKEGGEHWVGNFTAEFADRKLDFNDLGYMRRQNWFRMSANAEYRTLKPWRNTLETHTRVEFYHRNNLDGLTLARGYQINSTVRFDNFWELFVELHYREAYFDDREVEDGTALQREGLVGLEVAVSSDRRRRVYGDLFVQTQAIFNGFNFAMEGDITFRLLPQLDLQLLPQAVYTFGEPRYVGHGGLPGESLFGRLEAKSVGATLRATLTFTPRLTLQVYSQFLLASKHFYDFFSYQADPSTMQRHPVVHLSDLRPANAPTENPDFAEPVINLSAVLRWEYMPGSILFFVYTRSQAPALTFTTDQAATLDLGAFRNGPASDALLVKFTHWYG